MTHQSIYQKLVAAGCEVDSHESDLYAKATPDAVQLTNGCGNRTFFVSHDGSQWLELPFAYDPWWEARRR